MEAVRVLFAAESARACRAKINLMRGGSDWRRPAQIYIKGNIQFIVAWIRTRCLLGIDKRFYRSLLGIGDSVIDQYSS